MTLEEAHAAVINDPEDDGARLAYADACEAVDRVRAEFIRWSVAYDQWLIGDGFPPWAGHGSKFQSTPGYLNQTKLEAKWARDLVPYCWSPVTRKFDRGFVISITTTPATLLEHGERILQLAPIRFVELTISGAPSLERGIESHRFPMKELFASPLLKRLDGITFWGVCLTLEDVQMMASSPHLERLLYLNVYKPWQPLPNQAWDILAASPTTRKLLTIEGSIGAFPGDWEDWSDMDPYMEGGVPRPVRPHGRELEAKYGYIPWLHRYHNSAKRYHMGRLVARGKLPRYPVGAPVTEEMYAVPEPVRNNFYW